MTKPYDLRYKFISSPARLPETVQIRDTFQTPNYAIDLLIPFIPKWVHTVWECASGEGKIAKRLEHFGLNVKRTDIRQAVDNENQILNFITENLTISERNVISMIITNPPYSIKREFIERAFEYKYPFAFLINADYSGQQIDWIKRGCEKIIPNRRINYITPTGRQGETSGSQFHSMWLTYGLKLGQTETFVDLPIRDIKESI